MTSSRRRRAAMMIAGAFVGAPLFAGAAVSAAPPRVVFYGHPTSTHGAVSCPSKPSIGAMTVPSGARIDFVNNTGKSAVLWVDDSEIAMPDRSLVPVTFKIPATLKKEQASITVSMLPDCPLDLGTHEDMTVVVKMPSPAPSASSSDPVRTTTPHPTRTPSAPASRTTTPSGASVAPSSGSPDAEQSSGVGAVPSPLPGGGTPGSSAGASGDPLMTAEPAISVGSAVLLTGATHGANGLLIVVAALGVTAVSIAIIRAIVAHSTRQTFDL